MHECRFTTVTAKDGFLVVDFSEPYLRRELRAYFEKRYFLYVSRRCKTLQTSGILFALDLSQAAVEGLVRLFVDRAVLDPTNFGESGLIDLGWGLRTQLPGDVPSGNAAERLAWLVERLAVEARLRAHFYGRLALLLREMLARPQLRAMVRTFLKFL